MKTHRFFALACGVAFLGSAWAADNPFSAFKGKMKEGNYEYKMEMDMGQMPGMPPGMGKQSMTTQHCLKNEDLERNGLSKGRDGKGMPENCKVENFKMSGNTASYTMVCKGGPDMTADNVVTFTSDGYKMDMKMAMNREGHVMNMTQHMEGKYLGPCTTK
jgi:hypothetical protein